MTQIYKKKVGTKKKSTIKVKLSKAAGKGTESGTAQVAEKVGAVHVLLEDAAGHSGQDFIDMVMDIFD